VPSLEGAFQAAKISITRADLRKAIDGGATALRVLLSMLVQKATPAMADITAAPEAPTLVLSIDQGEAAPGRPSAALQASNGSAHVTAVEPHERHSDR